MMFAKNKFLSKPLQDLLKNLISELDAEFNEKDQAIYHVARLKAHLENRILPGIDEYLQDIEKRLETRNDN